MIIASNFKYSSRNFLDDRQQCPSLSVLQTNSEEILYPVGFEVYCVYEKKWYQNVADENQTPIWEERKGGVGVSNDDLIADGEVLNNKTWSSSYIDAFKTNLEQLITNNEDYIAEIEDRVLYIEGELQWFETFDGSYNSLTDKPNIPSKTSELENDSNYITTEELNDTVNELKDNMQESIESVHTHSNKEVLDNITEEKVSLWDNMIGSAFNGDYNYLENKPITYLGDDSDIIINLNNVENGIYIINGKIGDVSIANSLGFIDKSDTQIVVTLPKLFKVITLELIENVWTKVNEFDYQVDKTDAKINNSLSIGTDNIIGENNQIVQGKFNEEDTEGKYINIVGNGTDNDNRKNIHTLDWDGNAWYNGKVSQEGVPTEDKDLVTKGYVDGKFATSERVEQYIENNDKENARRDVIIDALANGRKRTVTVEDGEGDLLFATEKDTVYIDSIEGETLVNVCDQEEPIAITKSYTVENTNHVPLQGEYDGHCRPIVYGNTLVNRNVEYNESIAIGQSVNASGTEINIEGTPNSEIRVSLEGHTAINLGTEKGGELCKSFDDGNGNEINLVADKNSKTDVVVEGGTLVNLCSSNIVLSPGLSSKGTSIVGSEASATPNMIYSLNQNIEPEKTYTLVYKAIVPESIVSVSVRMRDRTNEYLEETLTFNTTTTHEVNLCETINVSNRYESNTTGIGVQVSFYTLDDANFTGSILVENPMLFEGDLTQTPHLIPTEYVEGIKSSFEDKLIPYSIYDGSLLTSISGTQYKLDMTVKANTTYTIVTTMNTSKYQYSVYSQDELTCYLEYSESSSTDDSGNTVITNTTPKTSTFSCDTMNVRLKIRLFPSYMGDDYAFTLSEVQNTFLIVEGDWSGRENLLTSEYFGKYRVDIQSVGKNLISNQYWTSGTYNLETGEDGSDDKSNIKYINYIPVTPSTSYYLNQIYNKNSRIFFYDVGKKYINNILIENRGSFITPSNARYIKIHYNYGIEYLETTNIQLEENSTATDYEPYYGTTKTFYLNSPLYKGDRIEMYNGKLCHYHKMGSMILNGSEDWRLTATYEKNIRFVIGTLNIKYSKGNIICDRFISYTDYPDENNLAQDIEGICDRGNGTGFNIQINQSKLSTTDVNGFKQWLSENPTTVVYELANPWYEPLGEYGKLVLDGSEINWYSSGNEFTDVNGIPYFECQDYANLLKHQGDIKCDNFTVRQDIDTDKVSSSTTLHGLMLTSTGYIRIKNGMTELSDLKQWLQKKPTTIIYELAEPQPIDEDMTFNISTNSTLTYESNVSMGTSSFLPYIDELNLLESSTQYTVSFDCDIEELPLIVSLGGTTTTINSQLHNTLSIVTPPIETDGKFMIDGYGMANIDNIVITKGEMVYPYFEGIKSSFENGCLALNNLIKNTPLSDNFNPSTTSISVANNIYRVTSITDNHSYIYMCIGYIKDIYPNIKSNTDYTIMLPGFNSNCTTLYTNNGRQLILYDFTNNTQVCTQNTYMTLDKPITNITTGTIDLSHNVRMLLYVGDNGANGKYSECKDEIVFIEGTYSYEEMTKYKANIKLKKSPIEFGKGGRL